MMTMNISLPDDMRTFIDGRIAREGYASVSEYVRALIREEQKRQARLDLEAKLVEGLEGPSLMMTREDWDGIRRDALRGTPIATSRS